MSKFCEICDETPECCVDYGNACEGEVTFGPDPFQEEIHGDDTPVWMCEEHRYQSAMDI